jgi:hypothetical protein
VEIRAGYVSLKQWQMRSISDRDKQLEQLREVIYGSIQKSPDDSLNINTRDEGSVNFNKHYTYNFVSHAVKIRSNWAHSLENDTWKTESIREHNIKICLTGRGRKDQTQMELVEGNVQWQVLVVLKLLYIFHRM